MRGIAASPKPSPKRFRGVVVLVLALLAAAAGVGRLSAEDLSLAQDDGSRAASRAQAYHFALRGYYLWEHFSLRERLIDGNALTAMTYRGRPGGGFDAEYLFVPTFGVTVAASQTQIGATEVTTAPGVPTVERKGNISVRPITVGINEHPFQWKHVDFYIGAVAGVVQYGGGSFRPDASQFVFGSDIGFDIPIGDSGFALTAAGRVLSARFPSQFTQGGAHFHDQYLYGGGVSYRW